MKNLFGEEIESLFDRKEYDPKSPLIVSYGGGTNSKGFRWNDIDKLTPIEIELLSLKSRQCKCVN